MKWHESLLKAWECDSFGCGLVSLLWGIGLSLLLAMVFDVVMAWLK